MSIFWRVYFAHLLTDFTFQTEQLVKWKRKEIWGLALHILIFFFLGSILTISSLGKIWQTRIGLFLPGWICLLLLSGIHFLLDRGRVKIISWRGAKIDSLCLFLLDQVFHFSSIYFLTPYLGEVKLEKWILIGCLVVLATHFTNIFLYYLEKSLKTNYREEVKIYTFEKYYSLIERLFIVACFLLPRYWWLGILLLLGLRLGGKKVFHFNFGNQSFSSISLILSYSFAIFWGILTRIVYFI